MSVDDALDDGQADRFSDLPGSVFGFPQNVYALLAPGNVADGVHLPRLPKKIPLHNTTSHFRGHQTNGEGKASLLALQVTVRPA